MDTVSDSDTASTNVESTQQASSASTSGTPADTSASDASTAQPQSSQAQQKNADSKFMKPVSQVVTSEEALFLFKKSKTYETYVGWLKAVSQAIEGMSVKNEVVESKVSFPFMFH